MKVTITGGCGFIGGRLARRGVQKGWNVTILDNFSRFSPTNLSGFADSVDVVHGNAEDRDSLKKVLTGADIVFHLSGISRAVGSTENPAIFFQNNVTATHNVLDLCRETPTRVVFPSSWILYSRDTRFGEKTRETDRVNPETPYALSKLIGEEYARLYNNLYGEDVISLRLSNVYGPGDRDRIIPLIIERALKGRPLVVNGNPRFLNFIYVEDVVDAMLKIAEKSEFTNRIYNIGHRVSTNLLELATMIKKMCASSSSVEIGALPEREFAYYCPDVSLAERELGFVARTDMQDGLRECVDWATNSFRENTDASMQNLRKSATA